MSADLFVELRCEELPTSMIRPALMSLRDGLLGLLAGIAHGPVHLYSTPRRLAVHVEGVASARAENERLVTGPPAERAYREGRPTPAAEGFARAHGRAAEDLEVVDTPKGRVIALRVREGGEQTRDVVSAGLARLVQDLPFEKAMEWGKGGFRFGRPLHAVAASYDGVPLEGAVAGLPITCRTEGHRLSQDRAFDFHGVSAWREGLRARAVEPDRRARRARVVALLAEASAAVGADPVREPELLEEVTDLVEWPGSVVGSFDEDLLDLPHRLLEESMRVHQRYFPLRRGGRLTNRFVVITNNPWADPEVVARGNARVLRARFHDARFFYATDRQKPLATHGEGLSRMRWIRGLGTMAQKQARVAQLGAAIGELVGADPAIVHRAGELCKADLTTQMVGEFPELQGHMGRLYAAHEGEEEAVALAIEEHYLPRFADDAVPSTPAGLALSLADRVDTLVGCFGIGLVPKGGGDPQGLRRAAAGIVSALSKRGVRLDLAQLVRVALDVFHAHVVAAPEGFDAWTRARGTKSAPADHPTVVEDIVAFLIARFEAQAVAEGASADLVEAVTRVTWPDPVLLHRKLTALRRVAGTPDFVPILQTFKRVLNITRDAETTAAPDAALGEPAERALRDATAAAADEVTRAVRALDFDAALDAALALREPVATFFDAVLVDAPDPAVRAVRMGLLKDVARVFLQVADFSRISTR